MSPLAYWANHRHSGGIAILRVEARPCLCERLVKVLLGTQHGSQLLSEPPSAWLQSRRLTCPRPRCSGKLKVWHSVLRSPLSFQLLVVVSLAKYLQVEMAYIAEFHADLDWFVVPSPLIAVLRQHAFALLAFC